MTAAADLRRLVNGFRVSQAIHVAVVLGLADRLADGPRSAAELAAETGCHADSLYRLLRALATVGVFEELDGQRFGPTPMGDALRDESPDSVAGYAAFVGRPYYWQAWSSLLHSVRTGENAFRSVHGQGVWEYRGRHPDESAIFDGAMTSQSRFVVASVLGAYDFGRFATVIDVGGGRGAFVAALLDRWPNVRGVVFDQSHVVSGAYELLRHAGVESRCQVASGSFFDTVPAGGDAYVLKSVLHDWPDAKALAILRTCRREAGRSSRLILVERLIGGPNQGADSAFSDLNMLVAPGGQERTEEQFASLLTAAGFRLTTTVVTESDVSVIEAVPV
jgi:hypothetical protein